MPVSSPSIARQITGPNAEPLGGSSLKVYSHCDQNCYRSERPQDHRHRGRGRGEGGADEDAVRRGVTYHRCRHLACDTATRNNGKRTKKKKENSYSYCCDVLYIVPGLHPLLIGSKKKTKNRDPYHTINCLL